METSPDIESSPELSESFVLYLEERKKKAEEVKMKLANPEQLESPRTSRTETFNQGTFSNVTLFGPDNTLMQCTDDSFLAMEKICENTVNLGNVSANFLDLTALEKQKSPLVGDETRLNDIEAPSFLLNNTSLLSSNKNSPLLGVHANRPSTILEVSEASNKTHMSSYQTAFTGTETSEEYKTASEETFSNSRRIDDVEFIKMPKIRSFYDGTVDMTKDSLDASEKNQNLTDMTKDSLVVDSYANESSSDVESSFAIHNESGEVKMNDTLERIEFMLAQAEKMREEQATKSQHTTPAGKFVSSKPSPAQPRVFSKATPVAKARNSPLIKFSPVAKSPLIADATFKKPITNSSSKIPPLFSNNKKFMHIASPIARYIKETPGLPLSSTARVYPGIGNNSPRQFNFRDSETYSNENESLNAYKGPSLPPKAKTKSSATSQVR